MTDLESPKKNNDCYFYYYSTCAKGDSCTFRHEPSALGCETMCSFWKEGKCLNVHCNFRHMELRKNRKAIPCYWESQPVGCLKAHCPFMHQNPRPSDEVSEKSNISAEKSNDDSNERKVTAVDSLVVNFEEESDNESMPTYSPLKTGNRIVKIKTLEEIKLEKIQAESAAYYSFSEDTNLDFPVETINSDDLRERIVRRVTAKQLPHERIVVYPRDTVNTNKRLSDDELAYILGDESLRKRQKIVHQKDDGNYQITFNKSPESKKGAVQKCTTSVQNIKIKTLAEIRAERNARRENLFEILPQTKPVALEEEAEVSSTSMDETAQKPTVETRNNQIGTSPKRKIKLRRKLPVDEENVVSSNENTTRSIDSVHPISEIVPLERTQETPNKLLYSSGFKTKSLSSDSDKMEEDVLLLGDDEDEYEDVTLKAEDELLNEINSFIDN